MCATTLSVSPASAAVALSDLCEISIGDVVEMIESRTMLECSIQEAAGYLGENIMKAYEDTLHLA